MFSRIGRGAKWVLGWVDDHSLALGLGVLLLLVLVAALSPRMFITIEAGHEGVLFRRFGGGTDIGQPLAEGFHVVAPWNSVYDYDIRFQNKSSVFDAHTKDGLNLKADLSFRYRLQKANVPLLHQVVGPDYVEKLILPALGARVREAVAGHSPEEVYSSQRTEIQETIRAGMLREFPENGEADRPLQRIQFIEFDQIYLRDVELPASLQRSMVEKNQQQQMSEEYKYRIARETQESERKEIEAKGIRRFQDIVKDGITDRYLMWKGIDATLQLAQSPNAKVIVIGAGKTGLPILLGNLDATMATSGVAAPSAAGQSSGLTPLANTPGDAKTSEAPPDLPSVPLSPSAIGDDEKSGAQLALPPSANSPASDGVKKSPPPSSPGSR
jgi:regulator of protease activity HflC (stomatin/prohibitin superfamily)